jgi:hypothetical protein
MKKTKITEPEPWDEVVEKVATGEIQFLPTEPAALTVTDDSNKTVYSLLVQYEAFEKSLEHAADVMESQMRETFKVAKVPKMLWM